MAVNVPQFTDVEDTIVGPFTAKQLGWFGLGGAVIFLLYVIFEGKTFIFLSILAALIVLAFAFLKPYDQPLTSFISAMAGFFLRPKTYVWQRTYEHRKSEPKKVKPKKIQKQENKDFSIDKIEKISKVLDSEGMTKINNTDTKPRNQFESTSKNKGISTKIRFFDKK